MKLTTLQIDQLFTFTRQHYVEWCDLQSELVDHLANAIKAQWQENPTFTFDQALNILLAILIFIILKIIPSKAEEYLLATYPEYRLEKL
jgi:hypothetical protein